jgi:methylenetetrahydrofolate--tRNA-(uracil-5-)-methyltransferase
MSKAPRSASSPDGSRRRSALLSHITGGAEADSYQPMNVNFGLFPPLDERAKKAERKLALTSRARRDLAEWMETLREPALA